MQTYTSAQVFGVSKIFYCFYTNSHMLTKAAFIWLKIK